jgi:hypothetical protein
VKNIAAPVFVLFVCTTCALGQVSTQDAPSRASPSVRVPNAPPMGQTAPMGGVVINDAGSRAARPTHRLPAPVGAAEMTSEWTREQCGHFLALAALIPDLQSHLSYGQCRQRFPEISSESSSTASPEAAPKN